MVWFKCCWDASCNCGGKSVGGDDSWVRERDVMMTGNVFSGELARTLAIALDCFCLPLCCCMMLRKRERRGSIGVQGVVLPSCVDGIHKV